jgi:hypothetical protein
MLKHLALVSLLFLTACISVPDEIRADFEGPDGKRPNNYGRATELPDGTMRLEHDTPTVTPAPKPEPKPQTEDEDA